MEAQGHAVTIYARQDNGRYELDAEAFRKILDQDGVRDHPIMVLSVAGAMREGKSFLLNLFIRYLSYGMEGKWLSDETSELDGFSWRGGHQRDTLGILMWNKPFHVADQNRRKVAVLLMDTQGAFDNEHSLAESTRIITMSLMMSSLQIYNVMQNLRADKLGFFAFFLEYAKMAKGKVEGKVFQSLLFLVRDWPYQKERDFGSDGGTLYIKEQMKQFSSSGGIGKKDFKETFNEIFGFLLPHPGEKVAEQRENSRPFKGAVSDMDALFISYLKRLAEQIFRKENVVTKKIAGAELRGCQLVEFAQSIARLLEREEMPEPKDLVEVQIQAHHRNLVDEFIRKFKGKMEKVKPPQQFIDDTTLENESEEAIRALLAELQKRPVYGGQKSKEACTIDLDASLKCAKEQLMVENRYIRNTFRKQYDKFFKSGEEAMENDLSQNFDKRCVQKQDIERACIKYAEKMKKDLRDHNFGIPKFDAEFELKIDSLQEKLLNTLLGRNTSELAVAESTCKAKELETVTEAKAMLLKMLSAKVCSCKSEIHGVVDQVKLHAIKKWDAELQYPEFVLANYRKPFEDKLETLHDAAEKLNEENKDKFSKDLSYELSKAAKSYTTEMEIQIGRKAQEDSVLQEAHKECAELARNKIKQKDISSPLKSACMEKLEEILAEEFEKFRKRNDEQESNFEVSCGLQKASCVQMAREKIREECSDNVLTETEISKIYEEARRDAIEAFQQQKEHGTTRIHEKYENELARDLEKLLTEATKTNKENENNFLLAKTNQIKEVKREYKEAMFEKTGTNEPLQEEDLKAFHDEVAGRTVEKFMAKLSDTPPMLQEECRLKLVDTLNHAYTDIQRENRKKKRDCDQKEKQIIADCLELYDSEMNETGKGRILTKDELDSNHVASKQKAVDKLDRTKLGASEEMMSNVTKDIEPLISDRYEHFKRDNDKREVWAKKNLSEHMTKLKTVYENEMQYLSRNRACAGDDLADHHRTALRKAEEKLQTIASGEIRQLCGNELEISADEWKLETVRGNDQKTDSFSKLCRDAKNQAVKTYKREMTAKAKKGITEDDLQLLHDRAQRNAIDSYSKSNLKGPQDIITKNEQELTKAIDDEFGGFQLTNEEELKAMEEEAMKFVNSSTKDYRDEMNQHTANKALSDVELRLLHDKMMCSIKKDLMSLEIIDALKEKAKQELKSAIANAYAEAEGTNRNERIRKDQSVRKYIETDCFEAYAQKMKTLCTGLIQYDDEAKANHTQARKYAFDKFRAYPGPRSQENEEGHTRRLDELCSEENSQFVKEIKDRGVKVERAASSLLDKARAKYETLMRQKTENFGVAEKTLLSYHVQAKNDVEKFIEASPESQHVKDVTLRDFKRVIREANDDIKNQNESLLRSADAELAQNLKSAQFTYADAMSKHIRKTCCHDLTPEHNKVKSSLQSRDSCIQGLDKSSQRFINYQSERDLLIKQLFDTYCQENQKTQNERHLKYMTVAETHFGNFKSDAVMAKRMAISRKILVNSMIKDFDEGYSKLKTEHVQAAQNDLPPSNNPECKICNESCLQELESDMEAFKESMLAEFNAERWPCSVM